MCMIKIFRGGKGWWKGWGDSSERCLKWGGGGWGSLRDLFKTSLNRGWVKAKVVRRGEGVLKVSPPLPPRKILIIHHFKENENCLSFAVTPSPCLRTTLPG